MPVPVLVLRLGHGRGQVPDGEPRRQQDPVAYGHLAFAVPGGEQRHGRRAVHHGQREPAGVLGGGGAHQPAQRRGGEVPPVGHDREPDAVERGIGGPLLQQGEDGGRAGVRPPGETGGGAFGDGGGSRSAHRYEHHLGPGERCGVRTGDDLRVVGTAKVAEIPEIQQVSGGAEALQHPDTARRRAEIGHRLPDEAVRLGGGPDAREVLTGGRPEGQRLDRPDRLPVLVREQVAEPGAAERLDAGPHGAPGPAGEAQALERERQEGRAGARVGEPGEPRHHRVEGRVQERGMQREVLRGAGRVRVRGGGQLRVDRVAVAPYGGEALEGRAVVVAEPVQAVVDVRHVDRFGPGGRPGREFAAGRGLRVAEVRRFSGLGEGARGVPGPRPVVTGPCVHLDAAPSVRAGGGDEHLHLRGPVGVQREGSLDGQLAHLGGAGEPAGVRGQFGERRAGKQGGAQNPVVGEPALRGQVDLPGQHRPAVRERDHRAEQGMPGCGETEPGRLGGSGGGCEPVALAAEPVGGQIHRRPLARPGDGDAGEVRHGQGSAEGAWPALAAPERARGEARDPPLGERLLHGHGEHRMRADLDEPPVAAVGQAAEGGVEADGLPEVAEPVAGVQGGRVQHVAGHRGVEGDLGGPGSQPRERPQQFLAQRLDVPGVGGVVHRDAAGAHAVVLAPGEQLGERRGVPGDDGGARSVAHGDLDGALPASRELGRLGRAERHRHHAAVPGDPGDGLAAQGDQPRRVGEGQRARDISGGDLALGVPDDRVRRHPRGTPHRGERHHDREQHRLHDVDAVERGRALRAPQDIVQGPVGVLGEGLGAGVDPGPEDRVGVQERAGHLGPLRPLTGEDEDRAPADPLARHDRVVDLAPGEGAQGGRVVPQDGRAVREPRPRRERGGHVPEVEFRVVVQVPGERGGLPSQRRRVRSRQQQRHALLRRGTRSRRGGGRRRGGRRGVVLVGGGVVAGGGWLSKGVGG
ncbi:hypothetical protein Mame01_49760 [Microbispora amethystogenes]|nr:hypothetical protein Mame01_49760 [Microbispora amethystogenes]